VLHLNEIGRLECLRIFEHLVMPDLVAEELRAYGLDPSRLGVTGLKATISTLYMSRAFRAYVRHLLADLP